MKASRSCNYDPELYRKVKEAVNMQQVAEYFGLRVNRKGWCVCPFHADKKPSLKIYPDGKGFYCFSCGAGGDPIKFAARYRGVGNYEAAKELAAAFQVPIQEPVTYRERREAKLARKRRAEIAAFQKRAKMYLTAYRGLLCEAVRNKDEHFWEGLGSLTYVEYLLDCLEQCPEDVYADRKVVKKIGEVEGRIAGWYGGAVADGAVPG